MISFWWSSANGEHPGRCQPSYQDFKFRRARNACMNQAFDLFCCNRNLLPLHRPVSENRGSILLVAVVGRPGKTLNSPGVWIELRH